MAATRGRGRHEFGSFCTPIMPAASIPPVSGGNQIGVKFASAFRRWFYLIMDFWKK